MTSSHTPGPWTVGEPFRYGVGYAGAGCVPIVGGNAAVCVLNATDRHLPIDANAHLIAAAPDMLAALREAHETVSAIPGALAAHAARRIAEAIAKAEGQS